MDIKELLRGHLEFPVDIKGDDTPADQISRQAWQEAVERLLTKIRVEFASPAFGLTEGEISIHYHRSLDDFIRLIADRLGYPS